MVKYGIISDTHFSSKDKPEEFNLIINQIKEIFQDVDEIVHAGDICEDFVLKELDAISPTRAIAGECDQIENLPKFLEFSSGKYRIGIIHEQPKNLKIFFQKKKLHILIFGHTHQPLIKGTAFNTLLINPGSPTQPIAPPLKKGFKEPIARPSVITMNIDENNILSTYVINLKV
jgi:putative phosphoesterase